MGSYAFLVGEGRETWRAYCERSFCFGCGYNSHKTFAMLYGSYAFLVLGRRGETHACLDCAMQLLFQLARLATMLFRNVVGGRGKHWYEKTLRALSTRRIEMPMVNIIF